MKRAETVLEQKARTARRKEAGKSGPTGDSDIPFGRLTYAESVTQPGCSCFLSCSFASSRSASHFLQVPRYPRSSHVHPASKGWPKQETDRTFPGWSAPCCSVPSGVIGFRHQKFCSVHVRVARRLPALTQSSTTAIGP
jgi:hypothetical protein